MADIFPPVRQRRALLEFAVAADTRSSALCRDECGDWCISGRDGHVYAVRGLFQLMVFKQSARGWTQAKERLGFGEVVQDGDTEGSIMLGRLPSRLEAAEIRVVLGIRKARHLDEAQRAVLIEAGAKTPIKGKRAG
jgi:hypothetical protein